MTGKFQPQTETERERERAHAYSRAKYRKRIAKLNQIHFHHLWNNTHICEHTHQPNERTRKKAQNRIICFHSEIIELSSVCCSVFPRRTIDQPLCCSAAADHFKHRQICVKFFIRIRSHRQERERARVRALTSTREFCVFYGLTAFSFVIFLLCIELCSSSAKKKFFVLRSFVYTVYINICTTLICWLFVYSQKGRHTRNYPFVIEDYAIRIILFLLKEK